MKGRLYYIILIGLLSLQHALAQSRFAPAFGYDSCVLLQSGRISVIIDPNAGGRVLEYALDGRNIMYVDSSQNAWVSAAAIPRLSSHIAGGRFDIGPSRTKVNTDLFFFGSWHAVVEGPYSVSLYSNIDVKTGLQVIRHFVLSPSDGGLLCRQVIMNKGNESVPVAHWGRTMAAGHGICIMPVANNSRFPAKYVMYSHRDTLLVAPKDDAIRVKDSLLLITDVPRYPKLEMDVSSSGWMAYISTNDLAFIKFFTVDTNGYYGDISGANASVWYNGTTMTELEPIGPMVMLQPGEQYSFDEYWFLKSFPFPAGRKPDLNKLLSLVSSLKILKQ